MLCVCVLRCFILFWSFWVWPTLYFDFKIINFLSMYIYNRLCNWHTRSEHGSLFFLYLDDYNFAFSLAPAIRSSFSSTIKYPCSVSSFTILVVWTSSLSEHPVLEHPVSLSTLEVSYTNPCGHLSLSWE